jgi:hypothetical protein
MNAQERAIKKLAKLLLSLGVTRYPYFVADKMVENAEKWHTILDNYIAESHEEKIAAMPNLCSTDKP